MFIKKYPVTILDEKWNVVKAESKLLAIPKKDELIYLENVDKYFRIQNIIHQLNQKHQIILVVKEFSHKIDLS